MAELLLHGRRTESVFQLLGDDENAISYSVAWALAECPAFLSVVLKEVANWSGPTAGVVIRLQQYESEGGVTDIEIEQSSDFYIIMEAKRGWELPGANQLEKYAHRKSFSESRASRKLLVAVSECSNEYASLKLPFTQVRGVPVRPVSWKALYTFALEARRRGSPTERRLLDELAFYLRRLMTMQQLDSNWVYVVVLASGMAPGWGISWIDIVSKRLRYFHPVGRSGWPPTPPNYIAFRYHARLQSIHHIDDYEIITNLHTRFEEIPDKEEDTPYFLYTLGPGFAPAHEVRTGAIYPNGRVWCMLDTLFTARTISEARDTSKVREAKMGQF